MRFYTCELLYISDTSSHSANIPDTVGYTCIIQSDTDLEKVNPWLIKEIDEIKELLDEYDCEDIRLEEIDFEDAKDDYADEELIVINENDLKTMSDELDNKTVLADTECGVVYELEEIPSKMFEFFIRKQREFKDGTCNWAIGVSPTVDTSKGFTFEHYRGTKEQAINRFNEIVKYYK